MNVGIPMFLGVSAILFTIGLIGVLLRRSPLTILLSLEIMLNSVNLTLVAFSRQVGGSDGQVFALVVMGIAAAEVVVGLGLVVAMTRRSMVLDTDELRTLNG
ncbi:MAG: NADH-quinone oxidoreductase subunit NuoK [Actinobacteria bacterium]|jgi:NADH-quinone oxidoreductase subunit K|nr:NADH-quinone oxidoreductase subunit NuoK [Actinomycetota bacterium]